MEQNKSILIEKNKQQLSFNKKKGLTGTQIKYIGVILMVLDHIHQMFGTVYSITWMNMLGRLVMPIFLFMCAEGYYYTSNRKKYALRLYIASVLMSYTSIFIGRTFPLDNVVLMNNVFSTMLISVVIMYGVDLIRERNYLKAIGVLIIPLLTSLLSMKLMAFDNRLFMMLSFALPSYVMIEGGIVMASLAALCYVFHDNRKAQLLLSQLFH